MMELYRRKNKALDRVLDEERRRGHRLHRDGHRSGLWITLVTVLVACNSGETVDRARRGGFTIWTRNDPLDDGDGAGLPLEDQPGRPRFPFITAAFRWLASA